MLELQTVRDRDAWQSVRGFMYQAELTVLRWLGLSGNESLFPETGEDLAIVGRAITESQPVLLEQTKHREARLTLRSPAALSSLAGFVELMVANPRTPLRFRYATNTAVTAERPRVLPDGVAALTWWQDVWGGQEPSASDATAVRSFLQRQRPPKGMRDSDGGVRPVWTQFQNELARWADEDFVVFVRLVEWATEGPSSAALGPAIRDELLRQSLVDRDCVEQAHARLFYRVMQGLSQPRQCRLTRDTLLAALKWCPSGGDAHELAVLTRNLEELANRVERLEGAVDSHEARIAGLEMACCLAGDTGPQLPTELVEAPLLIPPPPRLQRGSGRAQTVGALRQRHRAGTWLALSGGHGSGKTQLARAMSGDAAVWVSLRGVDDEARVRSDLSRIRRMQPFGAGTFLVLDDVPSVDSGSVALLELCGLASDVGQVGGRFITTSNARLPVGIDTLLPEDSVLRVDVPPFTLEETVEVLEAFGARAPVRVRAIAKLLHAQSCGHPWLTVIAATWLRDRRWDLGDDETLGGLLACEHTSPIADEVLRRVLTTVSDPTTRELLDRLSLTMGPFSAAEVHAVAGVAPVISRPGEHLSRVSGTWVERRTSDAYDLSPLLRRVPIHDLPVDRLRQCHEALADALLAGESVGPLQVICTITHLSQADRPERAAGVLLQALIMLEQSGPDVHDAGLLSVWAGLPIPDAVPLSLRLSIRAHQVSLRAARGRELAAALADLDSLLACATPGTDALATAVCAKAALAVARVNGLSAAERYAHEALLGADPTLPLAEAEATEHAAVHWQSTMLLLMGWHVRDVADLGTWLSLVGLLSPEQQAQALADEALAEALPQIVNHVWMLAHEAGATSADWAAIAHGLRSAQDVARHLAADVAEASIVRSHVIVAADYQHDIAEARRLVDAFLADGSASPVAQFLVLHVLGSQYVFQGQPEEARRILERALVTPTDGFCWMRADAHIQAARAASGRDASEAVGHCEQAVELARDSTVPEENLVRALGELGIAHGARGDLVSAFGAWHEATERLLATRADTDSWRGLATAFGHATGWLGSVAARGQPPASTPDGEEYTAPQQGFLIGYSSQISRCYRPDALASFPAMMCMWADAIDDDERSAEWASRAVEMSREAGCGLVLGASALDLVPALVSQDRYGDAIALSMEAGIAFEATAALREAGRDEWESVSPQEILGPGSEPRWLQATRFALRGVCIYLAFRLAERHLSDGRAAREAVGDVCRLLREAAMTAAAPAPWNAAADLLEAAFDSTIDYTETVARANRLPEDEEHLRYSAYIACTVCQGPPPPLALRLHDAAMSHVTPRLTIERGAVRRMVMPFLQHYWRDRVAELRTGKEYLGALDAAISKPIAERWPAIRSVVREALGTAG